MTALGDEFQLDDRIAYLNHAAVAPWPRRSGTAVRRFVNANLARGATDYPDWLKVEDSLRERLATLINAPSPQDIALLKSTSEGLSVVAYGIRWKPGDNLVIFDCEFPSNRVVWESLRRRGVVIRKIPLDAEGDPERDLFNNCDARTRLISVSSVQFGNGFRADLKRIGAFCRENHILFCIDAIQSIGALAFDCQACCADFVVADGHKWMLGPEGLALFYCRAELREELELHQYGWHMLEHSGDYSRQAWCPAPDARRFECGSPNLLAATALNASLGLLLEVGDSEVERRVLERRQALRERLSAIPRLEFLSCDLPARRSGILTVRPLAGDPVDLHRHLMAQKVICAPRGGGVRFSPHFYTPDPSLDRAAVELARWLKEQ